MNVQLERIAVRRRAEVLRDKMRADIAGSDARWDQKALLQQGVEQFWKLVEHALDTQEPQE
jgi:hypothetical protein